ncbi:MAG: hypothetical protein IT426_07805 [Pirellulales bacterium]|nr:hypothetical protein [Pirellulales bacterium]
MSRRLPKSRRGGKRMESVKKFFGLGGRRKDPARKARRLMIDPLEQRQLLSLSVGNLNDILVNQTVSTSLGTIAGQSLAVDHAGDAIAVWTRIDAVRFDPNNPPGVTINPLTNLPYQEYEQIIDPRTGAGMIDSNIYARYLTNQVQRIVLPESLFTSNTTKLGNPYFSMLYSGGEVQQMLSFSYTNPGGATLLGTIQLGINLNGDDKIDPLTEKTLPITFDETSWNTLNPALSNAAVIQKALRDLAAKGGDAANLLQNLTVEAVDSLHYKVTYPFVYDPSANPAAPAIPNLMIAAQNFLADDGGSGYLPSVQVTTLRQPTWIGIRPNGDPNIPVSLTNPAQTAMAIESAFQLTTQGYPMAPVFIPVPTPTGPGPTDGGPLEFRTPAATVKVVSVKTAADPLGLRTFDVTFVGNSGLQDHPLLVLGTKITNDQKAAVTLTAPQRQVATITKASSPEFRVNPPEPDDPFTPLPDVTQQSGPAVSMDADGDFVITWQSEVPDAVTPGSKYDIFAQRFSPAAIVSAPNLVISNSTLSILEGQSKDFTVSLASRPFVPVTVTIARRFGSDVRMTASAAQLTFTPANWDQPQSVTISTPLDADNTNSSAWFDVSAGGITAQTVTANAIDLKSLIVSRNSLSVVEGNSDTFNVRLAGAPAADVTINVSKLTGGDDDLTASPATLTFTPADWNVPQTVTVSAAREMIPNQDAVDGTADFLLSDPTGIYGSRQVTATEADDWAHLIVSTNTLTILEGNTGIFTVALSGQPTGLVEVQLLKQSDGDPSITTRGVTSILFDPNTWNVPQQVRIRALPDTDSTNGTAAYYLVGPNNAPLETVNVTMIDTPVLDIAYASESYSYVRVTEGGSGIFRVRLPFEPKSNVTVTITPETGGDANITNVTATLTFTPGNWDTYQTVILNAANDTPTPAPWPASQPPSPEDADGVRRFFVYAPGFTTQLVNAVKVNDDPWISELAPAVIPPGVTEPDPPEILSISSSTIYVPEGSKNYFDLRLSSRPDGDITMIVARIGGDVDLTGGTGVDKPQGNQSVYTSIPGAIIVGTLVFTQNDWNQPHRLWVFDNQDADATNGTATFTFLSPDDDFQTRTVTAIEADDDWTQSELTVSQAIFVMKEGGPTATFTVSAPADTTVDIVQDPAASWLGDPSISVSPAQVVLDAGNNRTATITITAANDADPLDVLYGMANFLVSAYNHRLQLVTVTQIDKDISPIVLSTDPQGLGIAEGEARVITARLAFQPTADVTVTIAKAAGGDADLNLLSTATLTFTPANWNRPQQVNLVAAEDDADGVNGTAEFTFSVAGYPDKTLAVSEIDNDAAALVVSTDYLPVLEGNSRIISVALPAAPAADVTVTITRQSGSSDLQVFPTTLTFTPANWNVPQLVKISAVSDPITEADTATFAVSATGYNGVSVVADKIDKLQGARPLGNAFRVNTFAVDAQFAPAVSMDADGNFVITWSNQGQDISFFNGIVGQRFNRDGDRVGNEFMVNAEDTSTHGDSFVSMSPDGQFFLVTWMMGQGVIEPGTLFVKVYNTNQSDLLGFPTVRFNQSALVNGVQAPTAAWNYLNDFILSWDWPAVDGDHTGATTDGVYGAMWDIEGNLIRDLFRANSGSVDPNTWTNWPEAQSGNQVAVDADGDVTVIYSGFGPDVSQNALVPGALYAAAINQMAIDPLFANSPLLGLFQDLISHGLPTPFHPFVHDGGLHTPLGNDPDLEIQEFLTIAQNFGATRTELGRMQQILSNVLTMLRGDANAVMFTQFDADPVLGPQNVLNTDNIVNAQRDGSNNVYVVALDQFATDGSIVLVLGGVSITIDPDFSGPGGTLNPNTTLAEIHNVLTQFSYDLTNNGLNWPEDPWTPNGIYEGPIDVRLISAAEFAARQGTDWDLQAVEPTLNAFPTDIGKMNGQFQITAAQYFFEITIQGELHDAFSISLDTQNSDLSKPDPADPTEEVTAYMFGYAEYGPNPGTDQSAASIGMQPNGSLAVSWTQTNVRGDGQPLGGNSVYMRTFVESTDTAGPLATDFILDDNTRLKNNGQVLRPVQYLVVTFDEAMATTGVGSILNKANWSLLKDGVPITGGISEIYFGVNAASQITDVNGVLLFPGFVGTNKYEAVIKLDANGATAGVPALTDGHYELIALNSMRDVAGNPLGRTGFSVNGFNFGRSFEVSALTGSETPVSGSAGTGNQTTQTINDTPSAPSVPHAVANDGNGDYVVVWTDSTPGNEGIWAKLYRNTWTQSGVNHVASAVPLAEIRVSSDSTDTYASVAMDGDGDFVVTWSRDNSALATLDSDPAWDVYARRYDALGQPKTDDPFNPLGEEFMVNTETEDIQRYSDVAMDVDGDFMITWQSMNQDESGYGVYMQRYSPEGEVLGGLNEVQQINFIGRPQGTFKLQWVDANEVEYVSAAITLPTDNNLSTIVDDIQLALEAMGAHVFVSVSGDTTITVEFIDVDANKDHSQIMIPADSVANLTGDPGRRIAVTTLVEGLPGEMRVNDTTLNDQMFPSIAANQTGNYVITWTAYGANDDNPWESDIYAKILGSNSALSQFNITLQFEGGLTDSQMAVFTTAAQRWEAIITGDVPDVVNAAGIAIDDILISASGNLIDGPGGILGQAGPDGLRIGSNIPYSGTMEFDSADLGAMEADGSLVDVITHEMGHVLGFGTVWTNDNVYVLGSGQYTGAAALAAYQAEFVGQNNATFVPVELGGGGGTNDAHWNEVNGGGAPTGIVDTQGRDMQYELMTGWADVPAFISRTTVGQFQDLGYQVDYAAAGINLPSSRTGPSQVTGTTRILNMPVTYAAAMPSSFGGGMEFLVNSTTTNSQKWSSVALDSAGNFAISWSSYGIDGTGSGAGAGVFGMNGIYARKFLRAGTPAADEFKVNTYSAYDQQRPQVAMNPAGDFSVVWESFQDRASWDPSGLNSDLPNSFGVYAQRYAGPASTNPYLGPNGEMGSEFRLNTTTDGDQRYPSVALDANGDLIAVWTGAAAANTSRTMVFSQRFDQKIDVAGPFVTNVFDATPISGATAPRTVYDNSSIANYVSSFVVAFDENMSSIGGAGGTHSVLNPNNWQLSKTGTPVQGGVKSVQWVNAAGDHRNPATGKFEVLVTFDSNLEESDPNPDKHILKQGFYSLTISESVQDFFNNPLDGDYNGVNGANYTINFTIDLNATNGTPTDDPISDPTAITNAQTFPESARAVATALNGNHIVTWSAYDGTLGRDRVFYRVFDADGTFYTDRLAITSATDTYYDANGQLAYFKNDHQRYATIACDGDGDFVVTWSNYRVNAAGTVLDSDVFARRFNAKGEPQGPAFRVNTYTTNDQKWSSVTMDALGDFIVTWSSYGQEDGNQLGKGFGVYVRRFNSIGQALAPEFQVNTTTAGNQQNSSVAMANNGTFIVVWQTDQIQGQFDIYSRVFNADGTPNELYGTYLTGEIPLNATQAGNQQYPSVAMTPDGNSVVVAWQSSAQDGNGWGIYSARIDLGIGILFPEARVNTSVLGDQLFPSVAMAYNGKYTITWSGTGERPGQADLSGSGVFYRQFSADGSSIGGETRVNKVTVGDQWISSVATDQRGKAYIVFTGPGATPGSSTSIYRFISADSTIFPDNVGAIVTEIASPAVSSILEGSVVSSSDLAILLSGKEYARLNAYFSEGLSTEGGVTGQHSVLNKQNWRLYRNGVEITGAVTDIIFGWDASTRKYRAQLTLDGNGFLGGTSSLADGDYQLVASESIWDTAGATANALDGDFDGIPGTNPAISKQPGYSYHFTVAASAVSGAEIRVNSSSTVGYNQAFSESYGTGFGREQTRRSVAIDHNGDFAVVWTSYGQDDATDPNGGGIYLRIFDNANNLLGKSTSGDILVNTTKRGNQSNAAVSMSADGNIIVVWQSEGQDPDHSTGIYGQLFDSLGNKIGTEFRVNTNYTNGQVDPAVAADAYGNFVVVWATAAQSSSYFNDVRGQLFDFNGLPVGVEFLVNTVNIPGDSELHPSVAMNYAGDFVVAWDQVATVGNVETNGTINNTVVMARLFTPLGVPKGVEFQADLPNDQFLSDPQHIYPHHSEAFGGGETHRQARNPQVVIDARGNFIVAWESWRDNDIYEDDPVVPESYGIYYRRFLADGTPQMDDYTHQANLTITALDPHPAHPFYTLEESALYAGSQVNPSIAMDIDGDFVIAWDGNGAQPNRVLQEVIDWSSLADDQGVFLRTFHAQEEVVLDYNALLPEEYTSEQTRANMTSAGSQKFPSLAMTPSGEYVVVWTGNGVGDQSGIFARRYKDSTDTAGPIMTRISGIDGKTVLNRLEDPTFTTDDISSKIVVGAGGLPYLIVTFDEAMLEGDPAIVKDSVTNVANYRLTLEGVAIPLAIDHIEYAKNPATNKYEAKVWLKQPLLINGTYTLQVLSPKPPSPTNPAGSSGLRDKAGNPLGRTGFAPEGSDFFGVFEILAGLPNNVTSPGTPDPGNKNIKDLQVNTTTLGQETAPQVAANANGDYVVVWISRAVDTLGDIVAQRYDRIGRTLGTEFQVSSYQALNPASSPQTLPDVAIDKDGNFVVVWSGQGDGDNAGVFARVFDTSGVATGDDIRVNQAVQNAQDRPSVAMDLNGNFVVSWTSAGQDSDANGVFARRFNPSGQAQGGEFLVNSTTKYSQQLSDVAIDANGNFTVVWQSDQQDGTSWGVFGQRFNAAGQKVGGEFRVNGYTNDKQTAPQIAMDAAGDFMVAWQSFGQDGSGYGVYARRYNAAGTALESGEFRVNKKSVNWQYEPAISADRNGNFVVLWAGFGLDDPFVEGYGIYAHMYTPSGATYVDPTTGAVMDEFQINVSAPGQQTQPAAAMDANGDFIAVWIGPTAGSPTGTTTEIYSRIVAVNPSTYLPILPKSSTGTMSPASAQYSSTSYAADLSGGGKSDINGDGTSDVLWFNQSTGVLGAWIVKNGTTQNWTQIGQIDPAVWKPIGVGDFNGDKTADVLWQNQTTGGVGAWIMKNAVYTAWAYFDAVDPAVWRPSGVGDFNGDGTADLLWQNMSTGGVGAWIVKGGVYKSWAYFDKVDPSVWRLAGVGDFNGDKTADVLWHNQSNGGAGAWIVKNGVYSSWAYFDKADPAVWKIAGVGDFNGDGNSDVLWHNQSNGGVGAWIVKGGVYKSWAYFDLADPAVWDLAGVGDFNGDGTSDVLWHNQSSGAAGAWIVKNGVYTSWAYLGAMDPAIWKSVGRNENPSYLRAETASPASSTAAPALTQEDLQPIVREAVARWSNAGLNADALARLSQVQFVISDLPGSALGKAEANRIYLDLDAAGNGWFVDSTPDLDEEFILSRTNRRLEAVDPRAVDRIDLLSVVEHELGHLAGFDDLDLMAEDLMRGALGVGIRQNPK